jgi:hypothetical protein
MCGCLSPSRSDEGAYRDRHETLAAGCDGRVGAQDEARSMRTAKPCGPVPPTLGSSPRDDCRGRRRLTSPVLRGDHGATVNTIAQGVPAVPAALWFLACAKCTFLCTQGSRVRPASGAPCALLVEEGRRHSKTRADHVAVASRRARSKLRSAQLTIFWHCGPTSFSSRTAPWRAFRQRTVNGFGRAFWRSRGSGSADSRRNGRSSGRGGLRRACSPRRDHVPPPWRASASYRPLRAVWAFAPGHSGVCARTPKPFSAHEMQRTDP